MVLTADFGMSRLCESQYNPVNAGTPQYMAPEVLQVGSDCSCKLDLVRNYRDLCLMQGKAGACLPPCDIWSAGVCAYVLLIGEFPFKGDSNEEILQSIYNGSHHSHMECLYPG